MRKNMKVIALVLVIGSLMIFGMKQMDRMNTLEKYTLLRIVALQGAEKIDIKHDSLTFLLDDRYITYYSGGYSDGIKEWSGK